jgi:hypothetical protein
MKKFKEKYLDTSKKLKILDVGSADVNGSYKEIFDEEGWVYHGADMQPGKNVDILLENPYDWSNINSEEYDVVISGQAFEHIEFFWITSLEINRILKSGGLVCIIAPAGGYEHKYPLDCWRFYPDGIKAIAKWSKMNVIEAYTEWDNVQNDETSRIWMDSVLICQKQKNIETLENTLELLRNWNPRHDEKKSSEVISTTPENFIKKQSDSIILHKKLHEEQERTTIRPIEILLDVYKKRKDLQIAFPEVYEIANLQNLFRWVIQHGVNEDEKLFVYLEFYKNCIKF